jgi:RNA polymerase sigma-70 factor, ECF subfamily
VVRLGGVEQVEDLVHEVFVTVGRRLPGFRGSAPITVWIFRITQKVLANHRRRQRFRRWLGLTPRLEDSLVSPAAIPSEQLEQRQATAAFYSTLDALPDRYRQVLVMFELEDMSTEEIATLMESRPATVRVWLHRARAAFLRERQRRSAKETTP